MIGALTLADHAAELVRVACHGRDRRGQYRRSSRTGVYGETASLPDLLGQLAYDCPKRGRDRQQGQQRLLSGPTGAGAAEQAIGGLSQDTFYVGNLKGVGRIYQQTFIDTYAKVACAKLYDRKTPITAADLLNDRVTPFFDSHGVKLLCMLTDRGSEYCGNPERHEYELYLAVEDVDHSRTKTKSPQTNGICERFHKTVLNEFYRVAFRKKVYRSIEELQVDLDAWIRDYNEARPHQGRWCFGKTPMQTFLDALPVTKEKTIAA
jgi:transposase InsO family protein